MAALAAVAALSANNPGAAAHNHPFYPQNLIPHNWYTIANVTRSFHPERMEVEKSGEQPLDLSSKGGGNTASTVTENKVPTNIRLPTLDTKHIFK